MIYFEDVCKLILRKFREDDETEFIKIMFKVREQQWSETKQFIIVSISKQVSNNCFASETDFPPLDNILSKGRRKKLNQN